MQKIAIKPIHGLVVKLCIEVLSNFAVYKVTFALSTDVSLLNIIWIRDHAETSVESKCKRT